MVKRERFAIMLETNEERRIPANKWSWYANH